METTDILNADQIDGLLSVKTAWTNALDQNTRRSAEDQAESQVSALLSTTTQLREAGVDYLYNDEAPFPNWSGLIDSCLRFLEKTARDAQVLTWLLEALLHEIGWTGFERGLRLFRLMIQQRPDSLLPVPGPGVSPVKRYTALFSSYSLTGEDIKLPPMDFDRVYWFQAAGKRISVRDFSLPSSTRMTPTEAERSEAMRAIAPEVQADWFASSDSAVAEVKLFFQAAQADLSRDGVDDEILKYNMERLDSWRKSTESAIFQSVEKVRTLWSAGAVSVDQKGSTTPGVLQLRAGAGPTTRERSIEELTAAAVYFETADPHSVAGYHLRRALRWLGVPISAVFSELIEPQHQLHQLFPGETPAPVSKESTPTTDADPQRAAPPLAATGRDDAIRRVKAVLQYLQNQEPHSFAKFPLLFVVEIANIPLERILEGALDESTRQTLYKKLGMNFLPVVKK